MNLLVNPLVSFWTSSWTSSFDDSHPQSENPLALQVRHLSTHLSPWGLPLISCILISALASPGLAQGVSLKVQPFQPANAIAANSTQSSQSVWNDVDISDGGFRILMPGEVDRQVTRLQIEGQTVEQTLLLATQKQHDSFYMVAWADLSLDPNQLNSATQERILEDTKTSFLNSFKGQLTEQMKLQLAGNAGMQYRMTSRVRGNPFVVTSRSFLVGTRLYHVLAAIPQRVEPHLTGSTTGFLQSFRLRPIVPRSEDQVQAQAGLSPQ